MILGIGIDLVENARLAGAIERHGETFLKRIFTAEEIAYCAGMSMPTPHYAARFAAKEALSKAFGTGIGGQLGWLDIEVRRKASGEPFIVLSGAGAQLSERRGVAQIFLSLSHAPHYATAQVILTGEATL